ncbi:DUF21 domain-containing protein [Camellia lanceoleosa]|uniref:DUF21 domain-containing protein n=1 Tax=Camellia lanceoleosa TaxID=1840588 RepID=A0ACC0H3L1_9ERIC|nr:DUF21 domain-containing protein [Camellia lanceoleosa]
MTVAGLQNVSMINSSFHRESQSPLSWRWNNHHDRPSTRGSSLLQMWRELEGEHLVSHSQLSIGDRLQQNRIDGLNSDLVNAYLSEKLDSDNGDSLELEDSNENSKHEKENSSSSEQSTDFGEVERERVRQIFREWMNSRVSGVASNVSLVKSYSRAPWLGENDCEKVRIIREWVRMTSQQRGTCGGGSREDQPIEIGAEIERVCDGFIVNHCEIGARRKICRLCSRQTLLDLLARSDGERQRELQELLEHRPVAVFLLTEITPNSIAVHNAIEVARFVVRPVAWLFLIVYPVGRVVTCLSMGMLKMLGLRGRRPLIILAHHREMS